MYTHYYTIAEMDDDLHFADVVSDIEKIIGLCELPIGDGWGKAGSVPSVGNGHFAFNGIEPDDCEAFVYPPYDEEWQINKGFAFCKTSRRAYDPVVCASLLVINHHLGDGVDISSDGRPTNDYDVGWRQGIAIYNHAFPDRTPYTESSVDELLNARSVFLRPVA